jgi:20S proteasome alpha/beta subunit
MIWARSAVFNLFMEVIMLERSSIVKPFFQPKQKIFRYPLSRAKKSMTLVIAAKFDNGSAAIICTDQKIDMGEGWLAGDGMLCKVFSLVPNRWEVAVSGSDITPIANVMERAADKCGTDGASMDSGQVADALEEAYNYWVPKKSDLSLTLVGVDPQRKAHLIQVNCGGHARSALAYLVDGSYSVPARVMLQFRQYNSAMPLDQALYAVCEAKFVAEQTTSVGKETDIVILTPGKRLHLVESDLIWLRNLWGLDGCLQRPDGWREATKQVIDNAGWDKKLVEDIWAAIVKQAEAEKPDEPS